MGISHDSWHKRRKTGGKRNPIHKKRKYELGRPAANTKVIYWPHANARQKFFTLICGLSKSCSKLQRCLRSDRSASISSAAVVATSRTADCASTPATSHGLLKVSAQNLSLVRHRVKPPDSLRAVLDSDTRQITIGDIMQARSFCCSPSPPFHTPITSRSSRPDRHL